MSNMKSRLPGKKTPDDIDAFISGAEDRTAKSATVKKPPLTHGKSPAFAKTLPRFTTCACPNRTC